MSAEEGGAGPWYSEEEMDAFLATVPSECPVAEEPLQTNRCPEPDEYGICVCCGHRYKVSCTCGTTFAERARLANIDREALRKFHGN